MLCMYNIENQKSNINYQTLQTPIYKATAQYKQNSKIEIINLTKTQMPPNQDINSLYQSKCIQFQQLNQQFNQLQQQSTLIMNDLEDQIKQLKRKNILLQRQVKQLKEKKKYIASTIQRQLDQAQKQKNQFKTKFKQFQKKVISLEIINQDFENQLRAAKATIEEYQSTTERTMQQLAILRVQLQQSTTSNQEQVTRLRQQLKETQQEITVMYNRNKKQPEQHHQHNSQTQSHQLQHGNHTPSHTVRNTTTIQTLNQNLINNHNNKTNFRQALTGIRNYLNSIDQRKQQLRKTLLIQRDYLSISNC